MIEEKILTFIHNTAAQSMQHDDFGPDFYSGTAGQAWFLFHAGHVLKNKKWIAASELKIKKSIKDFEKIPKSKQAGFYEGSTGILATAILLADKLQSKKLLTKSLKLWEMKFIKIFTASQEEDIFTGWSGSVLSFTMVWHVLPPKIRKLQAKIIKNWLDKEIPSRGFITTEPGMAHGLAGIALALRRFSVLEHWPSGLKLARFIEKHIDQNFNPGLRGWDNPQFINHPLESWCNGSSGIIIARRVSGGKFTSSLIPRTIQQKLEQRVSDKKTSEIPYCHGHFGFLAALEVLTKKKNLSSELIPEDFYKQGLINGHEGIAYYLLNKRVKLPTVLAGIKDER